METLAPSASERLHNQRVRGHPDRPPAEPTGTTVGFSSSKGIDNSVGATIYSSGHRKGRLKILSVIYHLLQMASEVEDRHRVRKLLMISQLVPGVRPQNECAMFP